NRFGSFRRSCWSSERRRRSGRGGGRSLFWSDTNRGRSRRRLFYQIDLPYNEPNHAKRNGNPSSSIHKSCRSGYSQTNSRLRVALGTGSCPAPPQGWHRARRLNPNQLPPTTPCVSTASKKYAEQVGLNRQPESGPQIKESSGENVYW